MILGWKTPNSQPRITRIHFSHLGAIIMTRWTDEYRSVIDGNWREVKLSLHQAKLDDSSVGTSSNELARLRKIVAYVDEILSSVDPELMPLSTWEQFQGQAHACNRQINAFNSNRDPNHLVNANNHADNLVSYLRPYLIWKGRLGKALRDAALSYSTVMEDLSSQLHSTSQETLASLAVAHSEADKSRAEAKRAVAEIQKAKDEVLSENDEEPGLLRSIEVAKERALEQASAISDFYDEALIGDSSADSIKSAIESARKSAVTDREAIEKLVLRAEESTSGLERFHNSVYGSPDAEGVRIGGLLADFDKRIGELAAFETSQKVRYSALNAQIESLLPGATSAGLASAYSEMKNSFTGHIKNASRLFYISLALFGLVSLLFAVTWGWPPTIKDVPDWQAMLRSLAQKLPFYIPILWLAYYATKRRSEYQRLQQEYAHKESLAKSYDSYKTQLEELDASDKAMQKEFIMKAIDAISHNASVTLDGKHGEKMPAHEIAELVAKVLAERGTKTK